MTDTIEWPSLVAVSNPAALASDRNSLPLACTRATRSGSAFSTASAAVAAAARGGDNPTE